MKNWILIISIALTSLVSYAVPASIIRYDYDGFLSYVDDSDSLIPQFTAGDYFSGYFEFDATELNGSNVSLGRDVYRSSLGTIKSSFSINGVNFTSNGGEQIQIFDNYSGYDQFFFSSSRIFDAISLPDGMFILSRVQLRDYSSSVYDSTSIPSFLNKSDYQWHHFGLTGYRSSSDIAFHTRGYISNLKLHQVSEPSSMYLFFVLAILFFLKPNKRLWRQ